MPNGSSFLKAKTKVRNFFYEAMLNKTSKKKNHNILFVHSNPESSITYRGIIDNLLSDPDQKFRVIAVDHIGFGLSDQADFEIVDMNHSENLAQLVRALDLDDITLVIHDWGGAIGTCAFLDMPERISALAP